MTTSLLLDLTRRYQEPQRHYHTLRHIAAMLHEGRRYPLDEEQVMAVWFHDAVYDPASDQNEQKSARLAQKWLARNGWEVEAIERVGRIVLDTRAHAPSSPRSAPVIDLDLMSLAAPWADFTANRNAIRREQEHLSDEQFAERTRAFFGKLLGRQAIYHTDWGRTLEADARANLERAIAPA